MYPYLGLYLHTMLPLFFSPLRQRLVRPGMSWLCASLLPPGAKFLPTTRANVAPNC